MCACVCSFNRFFFFVCLLIYMFFSNPACPVYVRSIHICKAFDKRTGKCRLYTVCIAHKKPTNTHTHTYIQIEWARMQADEVQIKKISWGRPVYTCIKCVYCMDEAILYRMNFSRKTPHRHTTHTIVNKLICFNETIKWNSLQKKEAKTFMNNIK